VRSYEFDGVFEAVLAARRDHEDYNIVLTGHSSAGGVATLCGLHLTKQYDVNEDVLRVVGFGSPPCVSPSLVQASLPFTTTIVNGDDLVARLSASSVRSLVVNAFAPTPTDLHNYVPSLSYYSGVFGNHFSRHCDGEEDDGDGDIHALHTKDSIYKPLPLYLPGCVYHITAASTTDPEGEGLLVRSNASREDFRNIRISRDMISHHYASSYEDVLDKIIDSTRCTVD
jgi:hypothetical protein